MSSQNIEFRPYRAHKVFLPPVITVTISAIMLIGYSFADVSCAVFIAIPIALLGSLFTKYFYDTSKIIIEAGDDGLRIIGESRNSYSYTPWEMLSYSYYQKNYKGFLFVVLSPEELGPKQVKQLVNCGGRSRLNFNGVIVISIDNTHGATLLKQLINAKIEDKRNSTGDGSVC